MREVIIACDFEDKQALNLFLDKLGNEKPYLKIGMELFYKEGPTLVEELKEKGYKIFLDLKLHDIPTTVYKAMKNISKLNVDITNVHASGGIKMMEYAQKAIDESNSNTVLIAVTQLTSTTDEALKEELLIDLSMTETIKHYAKNIKKAGLKGVVCSPLEAPIMKELGLLSVTPGIRFSSNENNDQVRVATPALAKKLGSSYIVVGRAITKALNPQEAYLRAKKEFN
jgi:orotidine-5'-phosphate decarboxylase